MIVGCPSCGMRHQQLPLILNLPGYYETPIDLLITVFGQNPGDSDNLTHRFTEIEIHNFLRFQLLWGGAWGR